MTGEVIDVFNDTVNEFQDGDLSQASTIFQMFSCHLVDVACFSKFHLFRQNVFKVNNSHWRYLYWLITFEIKNEQVVKFAKLILFIKIVVVDSIRLIAYMVFYLLSYLQDDGRTTKTQNYPVLEASAMRCLKIEMKLDIFNPYK